MTIIPDLEKQLVRAAERASADQVQPRPTHGTGFRRSFARLAIAGAVILPILIAVGALLVVRAADHDAGDAASLRSLVAQYSVLRRPQTAADRTQAGSAPNLGGAERSGAWSGPRPGQETSHYQVRISGLARYRDMPELTRVVSIGGVRVSLFVEHLVQNHALPKATVTGNDPQGAAGEVTRQHLGTLQRAANAQPAYVLLARTGRSARVSRIAPGPSPTGARAKRRAARLNGLWGVTTASLRGSGGRIVAVVPDGVARISWSWPREFNSDALADVPPITISAPVRNNVAVAVAPARFSEAEQIGPETVVRYAADGSVLARLTDPGNSASAYQSTTNANQIPGPATAQSRRAERDPSTPNRILIVPNVVSLRSITRGPGPEFFFKVLLNDRGYFLRMTGGPRPGCIKSVPGNSGGPAGGAVLGSLGEPTVRGNTYQGSPVGLVNITCRGVYRLSISVLDRQNQPYPPFGSATFTVR